MKSIFTGVFLFSGACMTCDTYRRYGIMYILKVTLGPRACMIIRHLQIDYWERCKRKRKNNRETHRAFDSNAGKG